MGELGRLQGGQELFQLQGRVSALHREMSWLQDDDDDDDDDDGLSESGDPNSNDVVYVKELVSLQTDEPCFLLWHTLKITNECREYLQEIFRYDGEWVDTDDLSKK
jgi:hypothetical protein